MTIRRLLSVTLTALVLLPPIAWLAWPWWSAPALRHLLQSRDIELLSFDAGRPGLRALTVHKLALDMPAGTLPMTITANDVRITWDFAAIRQSRVRSVEIAQLDLTAGVPVETKPATSSGPSTSSAPVPLPSEILPRIPVDNLDIRALHLALPWPAIARWQGHVQLREQCIDLTLTNSDASRLALQLHADADNRVDLRVHREQADLLHLRNSFATIDNDTQSLNINGELKADIAALAMWLPLPVTDLAGTIDARWQGTMPRATGADVLDKVKLDGAIDASLRGTHAVTGPASLQFNSDFALAKATLSATIRSGEASATIAAPEAVASLFKLKPAQRLPATLRVDADTHVRADLHAKSVQFDKGALHLRVVERKAKLDASARIGDLAASFADDRQIDFTAALQTPALPLADMRLQPFSIDAKVALRNDTLTANWQGRDHAKTLRLRGSLQHDLAAAAGELKGELLPLTFREDGSYLPVLLQAWRWPADLSGGKLRARFDARWQPATTRANAQIEMRKIAAFYARNLIHGIDGALSIDYRDGQVLPRAKAIRIARIEAGVPVTDMQFGISSSAQQIALTDFIAHVLGGTVRQAELPYKTGQEEQYATLHIEGLQLAQVLALQSNVEGTGTLDGDVPLRWKAGKPLVEGARLQARAPGGVLRYRGNLPASAKANQGLAIALRALENFHYHTMDVRGDYAQDGELALAIALNGRNPTAKDTPPVNFNLTIRQNIPALLESLQLGNAIGERIEKRINTLQQRRKKS